MGDRRIVDDGSSSTPPIQCSPRRPTRIVPSGISASTLPTRADHRQLLLVVRRLGEHAQVEQRPCPAGVVDDDEGVVEHVGAAGRRTTSSRWLTSWAPEAITRVGRSPTMRFMRSKKWHVFSTSVPPVLAVKRFQSPTLVRNGKRCSRIATMQRSPDGAGVHEAHELGGRRHVAVLQADPGDRARAGGRPSSSIRRRQSATVVHSGFSTSACRSVARTSPTTSMCVWLGVATTTASHSPLASRSRWSLERVAPDRPPAARPLAQRCRDRCRRRRSRRRRRRRRCSGCARCPSSRCRSPRSAWSRLRHGVHPTTTERPDRYPDDVAKVIGSDRWPPYRLSMGSTSPSVRLFLDVVELGQRVQGGRAPPPGPAVGDGAAAEAGAPARRAAARSGADRVERDGGRACGWRRRAPTSSPPRSPSSIGPRRRRRRAARLVDRRDPPRRRPLPAGLDRRRPTLDGRPRRPRRGRHARGSPRRSARARPTSASPTDRRRRSGCGRDGRRQRGDRRRRRAPAPVVRPPPAGRRRRPRRSASWRSRRPGRARSTSSTPRWRRSSSRPSATALEVASSAAARVAALSGPAVAFLPRCSSRRRIGAARCAVVAGRRPRHHPGDPRGLARGPLTGSRRAPRRRPAAA